MNVYRSIGGRANASGVERIDRDGQMEKLQMGKAEVTPRERIDWNNKAKLDPKGNLLEERYDVVEDKNKNKMELSEGERTRLPRKSQYSTESRLSEERGEKVRFHKSVDADLRAVGIIPGSVMTDSDTRNIKIEDGKEKDKNNGNHSNYAAKTERKACAKAFCRIASVIKQQKRLDDDLVVSISNKYDLSVERVLQLEKIAVKNEELAKDYSKLDDRHIEKAEFNVVPGVVPEKEMQHPGDGIEKESDEIEGEHLNRVGFEVGLAD